MVWFKVDDDLAFHRKTVAAGNAAMGLWVRAGSWCAQQLTDGFIPEDIAMTLGTPTQARRLVEVRLWERVPDGFSFHEWSVPGRQPTSREVRERRQKEAEKKQQWRDAKRQKGHVNGSSPHGTDAGHQEGHPTGLPEGIRSTRPDPTRPDPSLRSSSGSYGEGRSSSERANLTTSPRQPLPDPNNPRCAEHAHIPAVERGPACRACKAVKDQLANQGDAAFLASLAARRQAAEARDACTRCDETGWLLGDDGAPVEPAVKCDHTPVEVDW